MNATEYRDHMRRYSRNTMVMSFVVTKHPDYQAMLAAGREILPYLYADILDPAWYCDKCFGEGFEFLPDWQETWDKSKIWPVDTGVPCPACNGKGNVNSWACIMLLAEAMGDDRPKIPKKMQGKHSAIKKLYLKWGEKHGYLPLTPEEEKPEPSFFRKVVNMLAFFLGSS
jgi:hypothetical protein